MRRVCPQHFQDRVTRAGGLNRYGEPNFKLAWSQSETMRSGGVWPGEYIGYLNIYLANSLPVPPKVGYWMLLEWEAPETFGGELMWNFLHRDDITGLAVLGPYPHKGRYKLAVKLVWTMMDDGKMTIEPWPLNSKIIDLIIPTILRARKDSMKKRRAFVEAEQLQAEKKRKTGIDAALNDAKSISLLPSQIDDRVRLMEKQWSEWIRKNPNVHHGIYQQK